MAGKNILLFVRNVIYLGGKTGGPLMGHLYIIRIKGGNYDGIIKTVARYGVF